MATPSLVMIPSGYKSEKVYSVIPSNGDGDFTFTREGASGQPNSTRVNKDGLIEEVNSNVPRLDYSDGSCPSLLLEPQSTNLVSYSEDFSQSVWYKSGSSVISNTTISPDGTLNAEKITESNSSSKHQIFTSISSYTELTISFFAKKEERSFISIEKSSWGSTIFDLNNGSVVSGIGNVVYFGNGWYRCSATYTASTPQSTFYILLMKDGSTNNYQGDGVSGLYLWGVQAEELSHSTSYIPTNGAIATRLADVCTGAGNDQVINSSEGVLYFEAASFVNSGADRAISLFKDNSNTVSLFYFSATDTIRAVILNNGITQAQIDFVLSDATDFNKIAFKYKENDCSLYVNGIEVGTDVTATVPTALNSLNFDYVSSPFYGKTKEVRVYKEALTDVELQELTS